MGVGVTRKMSDLVYIELGTYTVSTIKSTTENQQVDRSYRPTLTIIAVDLGGTENDTYIKLLTQGDYKKKKKYFKSVYVHHI